MADKKISELPASSALDADDFVAVVEDGTTVQAPVADLLDVPHARIVVKDSPTDVRHPDFGGIDQTATVDASPAIQAAIDYITGAADPTTTTRSARSPLYIPKGYYKIASPIEVTSVVGFHMYGDGKEQTMFEAVGTMDRVFDFNGVSRSSFGDFSIYGHYTESITDAIHCRRNDTSRSTNYSTLYNIAIAASLRCVRGINIGEAGINTQNDTWMLSDLEVIGGFTPGETTWWQDGIKVGTGAFNNNLNHHGYDLNVPGWRRCFHIAACQFALFGFESGESEADFYVGEHTYYLVAIGGRSEGSNRMVEQSTTGSSPGAARFEDIDWKANSIHADGRVVSWRYGGSLHLKNCRWFYGTLTGDTPRLQTTTSTNKLDVTVDGCSAVSSLDDFLTDVGANTQVHLRNGWAHIALDGTLDTRTYGSIDVSGGAATDVTHRNRLKGDDYDRYQLAVDGSTYRGNGTAAPTIVAPSMATFNVTGTVAVGAGVARLPIAFGATIVGVSATVGTAPVGADMIIDVNVSGVSIFTTIANRPKILDGAHSTAAEVTNMNTTAVAAGSYFTVDVDQVGSTTAGSDLAVTIRYRVS